MADGFYTGRRVAVTGADGFIGSHLVEALLAEGAVVTALAHYNSFGTAGWLDDLAPPAAGRLTIDHGDIRDPFFVARFVGEAEVVFHLAALIAIPFSYVAPQSYVEVNVTGTVNVLEACRRQGTGRLVHTSTSEVYGTAQVTPITEDHPLVAQSPYSASKISADCMVVSYVRSFGLPAVILRPFNSFGPRQSERAVIPTVIRQMLDPGCAEIGIGDVTPVRDFNYAADIARAFLAAGSAPLASAPPAADGTAGLVPGTAYNAGTGASVTVGTMIEMVREITGSNKPLAVQVNRMRPAGSEVFELLADAARFQAATGWAPRHGLRSGLTETVAWWRARLAAGRHRRDGGYLL